MARLAPVAVVGAGVAGLTLTRHLARRGRSVVCLDSLRHRPERGLGLWGRSQAVLASLGLRPLLDDASRTLRIPAAAYRSIDGAWLSTSSDTAANRVRVCSLRESHLLAALEEGLPDGSVRRGVEVVDADISEDGVSLTLSDGSRMDATAVVAADGARSAVRRLAFGSNSEATDSGVVVHSGMLLPGEPHLEGDSAVTRPFETLARGRRFAMVPLAGGGAFWFATRHAPPADRTEGLGEAAVREVMSDFDGWHKPIPRVLQHAAAATSSSASTDAQGLRWERVYEAPRLGSWHAGRAVLLGDAAHGMPHNLAQGAAAAIEGAYLLGEALERVLDSPSRAEFEAAFAEYRAAHEPRIRQCRLTTAFTAALALPASPTTEAVRNAMRFVPQPLNGAVFDAALALSLGDLPSPTRGRWPLSTVGTL